MNTVFIAAAVIWLQAVPHRGGVVVCSGQNLITCWIEAERDKAMQFPVAQKSKAETKPQPNRREKDKR